MIRITALLGLFFLVACGPTLLLPGGALQGKASQAPSDWSMTDEVSTIQLETRPEDPYSVNIWTIAMGDKLYVHAGANRSTWVGYIETNPAVRVRVNEDLFELAATRVGDQKEFDAFADRYEKKYGSRPRNEDVNEAYLFRLVAR